MKMLHKDKVANSSTVFTSLDGQQIRTCPETEDGSGFDAPHMDKLYHMLHDVNANKCCDYISQVISHGICYASV